MAIEVISVTAEYPQDGGWTALLQGWHSCASVCHRPFILSLDAQILTKAYFYASHWMEAQVFAH